MNKKLNLKGGGNTFSRRNNRITALDAIVPTYHPNNNRVAPEGVYMNQPRRTILNLNRRRQVVPEAQPINLEAVIPNTIQAENIVSDYNNLIRRRSQLLNSLESYRLTLNTMPSYLNEYGLETITNIQNTEEDLNEINIDLQNLNNRFQEVHASGLSSSKNTKVTPEVQIPNLRLIKLKNKYYIFEKRLQHLQDQIEKSKNTNERNKLIDVFNLQVTKIKSIEQKIDNMEQMTTNEMFEQNKNSIIKYPNLKTIDEDGGFFNPIKYVKDKYNKTKSFLVSGSKNFTTKVQNILKKVGNNQINSIVVCRTPVNSMVTQALRVASFNQLPYEKLFHLFIVINGNILLEKNSVINMDIISGIENGTENLSSPIPQNTTITEFIERGLHNVGNDKFFTYSSYDNNCQYFILNLLHSNGINDDNLNNFIKQNTESIFETNPVLRKLTNNVTDIDGRFRETIGGTLLQKQCIKQLNLDQLLSLLDGSTGQVKPFGLHPESNELILDRIRQLTQPTSAPRVITRKRK